MFLPVRGDATLHWVDVAGDASGNELECGQAGDGSCDDNHRRGDDPSQENTRDATLPPEPFAIPAADEAGDRILTTHQADGKVAMFENDWDRGPSLAFVLDGLPTGAIGIAAVPPPAIARDADSSYLVTFRNAPEIRLVRAFDDDPSQPSRPFLDASLAVPITSVAQGFNSRGIAVDASARRAREAACAGDEACLAAAAEVPLDVFVSNRSPASLLVGKTMTEDVLAASDLPEFYDAVPLTAGPSRVVLGKVIDKNGLPATRVFVICFDSRAIFVYDPVARRIETIIRTGRGPHAFVTMTDPESGGAALGFIAHFTDSYIGVVNLDQRDSRNYGEIVLTVGSPTPPRASK